MLPKPFFDTQICELAANGSIPRDQWRHVQEHFECHADYRISPLTLAEILDRIHNDPAGKYFNRAQEQLRSLYPLGKRKSFFDFPRYFVPKTIFNKEIPKPRLLESGFAECAEIVLWATSRKEVDGDGVALPFMRGAKIKLNLERFSNEIRGIRDQYVDRFRFLKGTKIPPPTREQWAAPALSQIGLADEESRARLLEALAACYQFDCWLWNAAKNHNYDLQENISDLIDAQQLPYLCDPAVIFITNDTDHKKRLRGNPQGGRIKTFSELMECIDSGQALLPS